MRLVEWPARVHCEPVQLRQQRLDVGERAIADVGPADRAVAVDDEGAVQGLAVVLLAARERLPDAVGQGDRVVGVAQERDLEIAEPVQPLARELGRVGADGQNPRAPLAEPRHRRHRARPGG